MWSRNRAALQKVAPEFAATLPAELPRGWHPVTALDDTPTYRIEASSGLVWWGGSAAPRSRAAGLGAPAALTDENPVLPALAPGGELLWLLERLSFHQAIFTFCESPADTAAFLRLHDVSEALLSGRCVLLPPNAAETALSSLLDAQPGLRVPTVVLSIPGVAADRIDDLRRLCTRAAEHATERRNQRREALRAQFHAGAAETRWAFASLSRSAAAREMATAWHAAEAHRSGADRTALCRLDGPPLAGPLPHMERLAAVRATRLLCVGHEPADLRLPGVQAYRWHIAEPHAEESFGADVVHLAATPRIRAELLSAGVSQVQLVPWAAPGAAGESALDEPLSGEVLIFGDLPDASAGACRIEQPTHRQLWDAARLAIQEAVDAGRNLSATDALAAGQRRIGHALADEALAGQFRRLIDCVLIPCVWLERISRAVGQVAAAHSAIGVGWSRRPELPVRSVGVTCTGSLDAVRGRPVAVVYAWPGAWPALLPAAAGRGWPVVLCGPRPAHQPAGNGYFHADQHVLFAESPRELGEMLANVAAQPEATRKRCRRAMELVQASHTYARRVAELCES